MSIREQILSALRRNPAGLSAGDIIDSIQSSGEVNSVHSLLTRLTKEGIVEKHQSINSRHYLYSLADKTSASEPVRPLNTWHAHIGNDQPIETFNRVVHLIAADGTQLAARPANAVNWRIVGSKAPSEERRIAHYKVII